MRIKRNNKLFSKLAISVGRNPYHVVNRIFTEYNILCYSYLVIVGCSIIRIPCAFIYFMNTMDLTWYPYLVPNYNPIYSSVTKCKYYPIRGKHNGWVIKYLIDKGTDEEEYE